MAKGEPIVIVVTRGRKSGTPRSSPLMYFQFEGSDEFIVVASNYGLDHHPSWYLNTAADPNVSVEAKGETFAATARITQGEEHTALFNKVATASPRFARYRDAADRPIPVITLRRDGPTV